MSDAATTQRMRAQGADEAAALVRGLCVHLPEPEKAAAFGPFFDRFAQSFLISIQSFGQNFNIKRLGRGKKDGF